MEIKVILTSIFILSIPLFGNYWWRISEEFYNLAEQKGYSDRKYFWYGFIFNLAGFLLIIALPDKTKTDVNYEANNFAEYELPEI